MNHKHTDNAHTDDVLKTFFQGQKQEVADNGFSQEVLQRLPLRQTYREWLVIPFAIAGGIISFLYAFYFGFFAEIAQVIQNNPEQFLFVLFVAPVVIIATLLIVDRQKTARFPFD